MISCIQTLLQDAQHREAMDSLHLADRSSLMSEVHQLRGQLERVHHGESTGHSRTEKREGGGGDRVAESDRLLLEELKGELSQTKLELETTLKAQHKHLKEMDTLRLDEIWFDRRVTITASPMLMTMLVKEGRGKSPADKCCHPTTPYDLGFITDDASK